jgi:glycosyltransferase involved in cell wall biosynthesis
MHIISIITINLNNANGLLKTIQSVISQTVFDKIEFLVIDGQSKDHSKHVIEDHQQHIHFSVSEPDTGIYNAMNKGIQKSKGKYLLFLNSGDTLYTATTIEHCLRIAEKSNEAVLYGNTELVHNDGRKEILSETPERVDLKFLIKSTLNHQSTFINKAHLVNSGMYDEQLRYIADYDYFLKTYSQNPCDFKYIPVVVATYLMDGYSSKPEHQAAIAKERQQIQYRYYPSEVVQRIEELNSILDHRYFWLIQKSQQSKALNLVLNTITKLRRQLYRMFKK